MLTPRQRLATVAAAVGALILMAAIARLAPRPVPRVSINRITPQFDAASALEYTRVVATEFPDRVTGRPNARRAAEYIRAEFRKLGYRAESQTFTMWLRGERIRGENVVAGLEGEMPGSVAVIAHYDSQFTSHEAAEDNASGVGVLLELARVLAQRPRHRGLILAATDAEEWGMIGARELADFLKSQKVMAVISIDYLHAGQVSALQINCQGQFSGYSPRWLRELLVEAGQDQGARIEQTTGFWEWTERAIAVSAQDQGPLLNSGIPAINIATLAENAAAARARYHTPADVFRNFDPATFKMLGMTVEQAVAALDGMHLPTGGGMGDFWISPNRYMPGFELWLIQLLGIVPLGLAAVFSVENLMSLNLEAGGWRFLTPPSWALPAWLVALVLYALTGLNVLKRYELYPATPKDPFLQHVSLPVLVILGLTLILGLIELKRVRSRVEISEAPFKVRKALLFIWISFVTVVAFFIDPYAMWLFLAVFAYATLLLLPPHSLWARSLNALLLLAALLPFAGLVYYFGREIFLGWRILWYLVLQAAYRVWSPLAVALFLLTVVLWVQAFRTSVVRGETPK